MGECPNHPPVGVAQGHKSLGGGCEDDHHEGGQQPVPQGVKKAHFDRLTETNKYLS